MTEDTHYFFVIKRFADEREATNVSTLVAAYRAGSLTEARAMAVIAEIAGLRTFIANLQRELQVK